MRKLFLAVLLLGLATVLRAQTTITLEGKAYTLKSPPIVYFDGAGGVIDTGIKYNGRRAPKAVSTNPPWEAMLTDASHYFNTYPYTDFNNIDLYENGQAAALFAMICYSDRTQKDYCQAAVSMVNNIERYFPLLCDQTYAYCLNTKPEGYYQGSYGMVYYLQQWIQAYELVYSQLTSTQRQLFADKMLNDIAYFGGVGGSPSTSCTNPTVESGVKLTMTSAGLVTTASPMFGTGYPVQIGYWVNLGTVAGKTNIQLSQIVSIIDSEHASIASRDAGAAYTGVLTYRRNTWQAGDCGYLYVGKFGTFFPRSLTYVGGISQYPTALPIGGSGHAGGYAAVYSSNNTFAIYQGVLGALIATTADDNNAAVRSQVEITKFYNDWYENELTAYVTSTWTGLHQDGSQYGRDRPQAMADVDAILQMSLVSPPNIEGIWDSGLLLSYAFNIAPGSQAGAPAWGQNGEAAPTQATSWVALLAPDYFIYRDTLAGEYYNWAIKNYYSVSGNYGNRLGTKQLWNSSNLASGFNGNSIQWVYAMTDPAFPSVQPPTAVALNRVDATSGTLCPQSALISRTGWASITDTLVNFFGLCEKYRDHNYPDGGYYPGDYRILKGNYLIGDDGLLNKTYSNVYNDYNNGGQQSNIMQISTSNSLVRPNTPAGAKMPRADTDGTNNRYAYAMVDSTASYTGVSVTRVHRHLIHFKEGQDAIIVYDDAATSAGEQKQTYLHYPNNFGASKDASRGVTTWSGTAIVSTNPGTRNGDASQMFTNVLSPSTAAPVYLYTNSLNGTYPNGNGTTFRFSLCIATSTAPTTCDQVNLEGEFAVVHVPMAGTANTPPTSEMLGQGTGSIDNNHRGVEIDGSSPKVAIFPQAGELYTSASFTTGAYSGKAQVLIAGMRPGVYNITAPSGPGTCTVKENDDTCYFESTEGAMSVNAGTR